MEKEFLEVQNKLNIARNSRDIKGIKLYQKKLNELNKIKSFEKEKVKRVRNCLSIEESHREGSGIIIEDDHRIKLQIESQKLTKYHNPSEQGQGIKIPMHLKKTRSSRRKLHLINLNNDSEFELLCNNLKLDRNFKLKYNCLHNYKCVGKECNKICDLDDILNKCECISNDDIQRKKNILISKGQELRLKTSNELFLNKQIKRPIYTRCPNINCEGHTYPFKIMKEYRIEGNEMAIFCPCITNGRPCDNKNKEAVWFCTICGKQHNHNETACDLKDMKYDEDAEKNCEEGLKNGTLQKCRNCKLILAKDENCDKVDCVCGNRFCFGCGKSIQKNKNYIDEHLMIGLDGIRFECRESLLLRAFNNEKNMRNFINNSIKGNSFLKKTIIELLEEDITDEYKNYLKNLLYKF